MGIAFIGVVVSELLKRSGIQVLSEPIYNTSFLLPAVPLLGLILFQDKADGLFADYQYLFLLAAVMNVLLAFFRRSFLHALLAALAGNASLWTMFVGLDFQLLSHIQIWLIPPALSVLIVAQIFRHQLSKESLSTIRYITVSGIYLASTSEMLLKWADTTQGIAALVVLAVISFGNRFGRADAYSPVGLFRTCLFAPFLCRHVFQNSNTRNGMGFWCHYCCGSNHDDPGHGA